MIKRAIATLIVGTGILLPASAFAATPTTWRNCMRLVPPAPVRPKPVEPDVSDGGPFHAPAPPARPRQWISPTQHAEVFLDAAGVLRYDPATVVTAVPTLISTTPCYGGNCPR